MARIRTIKPEIAKHEDLYDLEQETGLPMRFAWCMLFTACDREGRFRWKPRSLKADVLPLDDDIDFSRVLDAWLTRGFIVKYRVGNAWFGWIPTWRKHQFINNREAASELPGIDEAEDVIDHRNKDIDASVTRAAHVDDVSHKEGKGKEGKGREHTQIRAREIASRETTKPARPTPAQKVDDAFDTYTQWERVKAAYPKFAGRQDWINAQHYAMTIVDQGFATWPELLDVVQRYAAYIRAKGSEGTQFVTTPGRFFTGFDDDAYWRQSWDPPQAATNGKGLTRFDRVFGDGEPEFDEHGNAINF